MKRHFSQTICIVFAVLAVSGATPAAAQLLQGGLVFGADGSDIGIRLGAYRPVNELFDAGGDFTLFFPGDGVDIYELNANGRYPIPVQSELSLYAVGGLNFTNISVESSSRSRRGDKSHTGINVGGMIEQGTGPLAFYVDAKFILFGAEQFEVGGGVTFDL